MAISQDQRFVRIDTPLGADVLIPESFTGSEGISSLFRFELNLFSEKHDIAFDEIIGKPVVLSLSLADGGMRYFNGIVSRFSQGRGGGEAGSDPRFSRYRATMVPWLWLLTRTTDSRIFQRLSVPEIVEQIFNEKGFTDFKLLLHDSYDKREYCVQYNETDFNFFARLLEDEGIFYFFEHENDKHTLVLADAPEEHKSCPKQATARYQTSAGGWLDADVITALGKTQEIMAGKYTLKGYNFEIPATDLKVEAPSSIRIGPGEREIYTYPGAYSKRDQGDRLVNIRMQQEEARITRIAAESDCRAFSSGYRFELKDYFRDDLNDTDYVITELEHEVTSSGEFPGVTPGAGGGPAYANRFTCIPHDIPYRPPLKTPAPKIHGSQTAIVVGPSREEIYTDEHGRIKVQFHWDREGRRNEDSSCWIRVSQVSAGAGWGAIDVPRIGQEVVVDFLEGDPDRPLITGRVYHGNNMPPFGLPSKGMVSGMKSNTTPGGGGYSEFTLNDTKGNEKITIHGQYDMNTTVENDQSTKVRSGNRTVAVESGTMSETVKGDTSLTVQAGKRSVSVTGGDYSAQSSDAVKLLGKGKGVDITGQSKGVSITGTGGKGVTISGTPNIEASGKTKISITSPVVEIGNAAVTIKGTKIQLSAGSGQIVLDATGVTIKGALVKIN